MQTVEQIIAAEPHQIGAEINRLIEANVMAGLDSPTEGKAAGVIAGIALRTMMALEQIALTLESREAIARQERAKDLLRSAAAIAERNGVDTNWIGFRMQILDFFADSETPNPVTAKTFREPANVA